MKKYSSILLITFITLSFSIPEKIEQKINKEIKQAFDLEIFEKELFTIDADTRKELPSDFSENVFYKIINDTKLIGYFYYGKAMGKVDSFEYLIILDEELIIKKVKILRYREEYGGEIGSKRWLKQFIGKKEPNLQYKKNIAGISGATISAKVMTSAVNNFLKSITILHQNKSI